MGAVTIAILAKHMGRSLVVALAGLALPVLVPLTLVVDVVHSPVKSAMLVTSYIGLQALLFSIGAHLGTWFARTSSPSGPRAFVFGMPLLIFSLAVAGAFGSVVYGLVPQQYGGGKPIGVTVCVDSDADLGVLDGVLDIDPAGEARTVAGDLVSIDDSAIALLTKNRKAAVTIRRADVLFIVPDSAYDHARARDSR